MSESRFSIRLVFHRASLTLNLLLIIIELIRFRDNGCLKHTADTYGPEAAIVASSRQEARAARRGYTCIYYVHFSPARPADVSEPTAVPRDERTPHRNLGHGYCAKWPTDATGSRRSSDEASPTRRFWTRAAARETSSSPVAHAEIRHSECTTRRNCSTAICQ